MINSLPDELIVEICSNLNYKFIYSMCCTCSKLYNIKKLIVNNKILITDGYPRPSGRCYTHFIPREIITMDDDHCFAKYYTADVEKYLQNAIPSLIEGDLIQLDTDYDNPNDGLFIFDGVHMIDLNGDDEYEQLPPQFDVIINGVPINYWSYINETGIECINLIWLDISKIKAQCINNAKYGIINWCSNPSYVFTKSDYINIKNVYAIYTLFNYDGITYYIVVDDIYRRNTKKCIYGYDETQKSKVIEFKETLNKGWKIAFSTVSAFYEIDDNVLYLDMNY